MLHFASNSLCVTHPSARHQFTFAGRGNRFEELRNALAEEDTNIRVAGFCFEDELDSTFTFLRQFKENL